MIVMRQARPEDDAALARIDAATWTSDVSPAPLPEPGAGFFRAGTQPEDVLVAQVDDAVAGYARLHQPIPLPTHRHVLELGGLAVHPDHGRKGIGRKLVRAAVAQARARGARKLSLRVLGPNTVARQLYAACGFAVEGVLREEFFLGGRYVDDILMAHRIEPRQ